MYVDYVYDIVRLDCEDMDAIYADYIKQMVGVYGFNALLEHRLIEGCGEINGRKLYTLCKKEKSKHKTYAELEHENERLRDLLLKGLS